MSDTLRCGWCLRVGHATADCPGTKDWPMQPPVPRTTADEVNDALAERAMLYRACKNGLLGYAAANGLTFPVALLQLDPDYVPSE